MLAIPYFFPETGALRNFKKNRPATPHNFEQEKTKNAPKEMRVFKHLERSRQLIMRLVIQPPPPPFKKRVTVVLKGQLLLQTLFAPNASRKLEAQIMKYFFS